MTSDEVAAFLDSIQRDYPSGVPRGLSAQPLISNSGRITFLWIDENSSKEEATLLKDIIERGLKLELSKVQVVGTKSVEDWRKILTGEGRFILFGGDHATAFFGAEKKVGLSFKHESSSLVLVAPTPTEIIKSVEVKKEFWGSLKKFLQ